MRKVSLLFFTCLSVAAFLAACTSHALQNVVPSAPAPDPVGRSAAAKVTVTITIATKSAAAAHSRTRLPHYFSRSSKALEVIVHAHDNRKVVIGKAVVDISPGSMACGKKKTTPRTCSASLMLASGQRDDFALFDYNAAPKSGKIPRGAHLLAFGRLVNKKIAASAKKNRFNAYLGGVITRLNAGPQTPVSFPADGLPHSVALMIDPVDYGNNPITAGKNDPYANPIEATVAETTESGHVLLSLNGGTPTVSVTIKRSTDAVEVKYDGLGGIGYGATVYLASGTIVGRRASPATGSVAIAPLVVGSTSTDFSPGAVALAGNGDYAKLQIGEVNAATNTKFAVTTQHCDAIASTSLFAQSSATSGEFAVIARGVAATPDPNGCAIVVSDGTSSLTFTVSNTYSGSLGSPVITTSPIPNPSASPVELAVGPDGALWFTECAGSAIGHFAAKPLGASNPIHEFTLAPVSSAAAKPAGAYAGPDGNVWFTDEGTSNIGKMSTAGVVLHEYPAPGATDEPSQLTTGPDGNMWFTTWQANYIGTLPTSGTPITQYHANLSSSYTSNIALGPDGNLWFTETDNGNVAKITPSGTITEFATSSAGSRPWGITAGPDGAMWFTECNGGAGTTGAIGRIPVTATSASDIQEFSLGMTAHNPVDITVGPDGALWFTYWATAAMIGRITTAATPTTTTITEYAIPGASSTYNGWGITSAPDGAIWFTDSVDAVIGRIAIGSTPAIGRANRVHRRAGTARPGEPPSRRHRRGAH